MECHACNLVGTAFFDNEQAAKKSAKMWRARHLHSNFSPDFLLE